MAQVLIVDDEMGIRELLSEILADEGHSVWLAENAAAARKLRAEKRPDLVLLDIWMPDTDGISLLKEWSASGLLTMPVVMMSGHGTIDSAVEATRIGATDFLEKPIALQKLLLTVKKALKHETVLQKKPLTLDAFARSPLLKDLKRRLEQAAAKTSVLLLKSASGSIAEICARTLQTHRTPWLDLSASSAPLTQEMLQNASGGIVFISDLAQLGKLQQMNLVFALERLERHNLQLVAASTRPMAGLVEAGWDALLVSRLGEVWVALPQISGHADDVPEIASMLLSHLAERGEVPLRHFSSGAQNSLRLHRWQGEWAELLTTVKNLALSALEEEISAEDVARILQTEVAQIGMPLPLPAMFFDQPLREAREAFERMYFEYHLTGERGSMTRLAEKTGLERTHLYRKLKQLGLNIGRRGDERD
ncbi:MAG: sigma-54-dependent Fis family transcriptional regulator [Candidatus Accumulibacter sp.]|jgi:two-component system nitrogen regulation response regulator NtrX|uniref:sigma-54-dependent transcriptional regulator n=1 Tax=Accumulibacter sp. TaxID=2053492 RepID=UPI001AD48A60|nr:response regulator [Accumulibacter sp.]MBK8115039.1 sigma-54-dependent Fis family transcriptional regulator [Accumulibacter sp.]MBK8385644.1 sigma-54-dependent Fis family transcriptional regulator [Accumulibacter sp.]MBK8578991.1 sigma-54-dependent Fis family transcriptional regulator [Candidatus Accumulibacter propinquus]MBN8437922.1 sigma-54-dependent Fis family transcriptional regulator [Accumulibacter sp.]